MPSGFERSGLANSGGPSCGQPEAMAKVCDACPVRRHCETRTAERPSGGFLAGSWYPRPEIPDDPVPAGGCVRCHRVNGRLRRGYCHGCYQRLRRAEHRRSGQDTRRTREPRERRVTAQSGGHTKPQVEASFPAKSQVGEPA
jgi:hypothetical protein